MASSLENIFSHDNLKAYSNSCLDLAIDMPDFRIKSGNPFDTIVIPSRGAVPFFLGMTYALGRIKNDEWGSEYSEFHSNLGVQSMLSPLLPENTGIATSPQGKKIKVLLIPFTADLNVGKFDHSLDNTEFTQKTREYWANVTAAFFQPLEERLKDPYFKSFTDVVLRDIEGRASVAELYEAFPQVNRLAFIDTVISGRASNEILRAFDGISARWGNPNMKPSAFLIVDKNGSALKKHQEYADYLRMKESNGAAKLYRISNIVSEDNGASLLGVAATMYPSIMRESRKLGIGEREFFVGAGSWHLCSDLGQDNKYLKTFSKFMNLIYRGIDLVYNPYISKEGNAKDFDKFEEARTDFIDLMGKEGTFSQRHLGECGSDLASLKLNRAYTPVGVYETHSRVVHIPLDGSSTDKVITSLKALPHVYVTKT